MKLLQLSGLIAMLVAYVACGQVAQSESKKNEITEDWENLIAPNYSIQYPDSFELDKSGQMGMRFILLSAPTSKQDLFRENVNLVIQDLTSQSIDLNKFVEISEGQIKTMITEGNLIESTRLTNENKEFQRVIYTGKQGQYDLKWLQYYWVENKKAYVLTLTCEKDQYDNYVSVGEEIMKTFIIK